MKNNLRFLRENKELTLEDMAARITPPASFSQIQKLETGQRKLTPKWKRKIALALDCKEEEIIEDVTLEISSYSTISRLEAVPLVGFIKSGGIVELYGEEEVLEKEACPDDMDPAETLAYLSKDRYFYENFVIFAAKKIPGVPAEFLGCTCLVEIYKNGELTTIARRIEVGSRPGHYDLYEGKDPHPSHKDQLIQTSSFIANMKQRMRKPTQS